jgi:hypothetical protein
MKHIYVSTGNCYILLENGFEESFLNAKFFFFCSFVLQSSFCEAILKIIIMFLDIIHCLVFYLKCRPVYISKHNVSETGFYLRPQVKPTQLGPLDRANPYLRTLVSLSSFGI